MKFPLPDKTKIMELRRDQVDGIKDYFTIMESPYIVPLHIVARYDDMAMTPQETKTEAADESTGKDYAGKKWLRKSTEQC